MALSNVQYDEIMRHYGRVQNKNRRIHEARVEEVHTKIPQIREFEDEMRRISVNRAKALLNKETNSLDAYKHKMNELREEKEALLLGGGFSADYLEEIYDCTECRDTGYANGVKCTCMKKLEIDLLYKQSYMDQVLQRENFDTFDWSYFSEDYRIAEQGGMSLRTYMDKLVNGVIKEYLNNFDNKDSSNNMMFIGPSGVGKTFLVHCIAKELIDSRHSVVYLTADRLFEILAGRRIRRDEEDYDNMYMLAYDCDLLVIDDLGTELNNSLTNSELFNCINDRILRNKATLISTNLKAADIREIYSERVASRIFSNYKCIPMYGDDLRTKKKKAGR